MFAATAPRPASLRFPHAPELPLRGDRPRVVGVVNVTPDSFSDGGRFLDRRAAVEHALALVAEGAELVDLGAESTRPGGGVYGDGAREVSSAEELERLLPVLEALRPRIEVPISVDTRKAEVARAALGAGADLVNDVSALGDPEMADVVREARCPVVLMHSRGEIRSMQRGIAFADVVREVRDELVALDARARAAGIEEDRIVLDPGLGFGKTADQNLALLGATAELASIGRPLLVGASRKSFLGAVTGAAPADRLPESLAAAAWAASGGAAFVRVHDVGPTRRFLEAWSAIRRGVAS